ncbi:TonB-dependent receptor domain-containing protein [Fluviicola sp.]|jgi:iron complex outermembrane receptor protein|uniref:TonB-dependent receptor n=1 Tax=Fluviicola sp. TaxID=1917219 RepID=UPI00281A736D|nr:TonB-dependent receptor [Fluviicola sp.]MDR0802600.1 TonB-dependent receptor [Fluviicola sp.]
MKFYLFGVFLYFSLSGYSQQCDYSITGEIRDIHTNQLIPFAKVSIPTRSTQTDSLGVFRFTNVCAGSLKLRCVPHFGCEPVDLEITVPSSEPIVFKVETHEVELDELLIEAYRFPRESREVMTLKTNDISQVKGNTLGDQLLRFPGVTSLNTGSSIVKPVINGMHSNRLVIVNNGIRQEGQQWGSEHAPEIDPNLAGNLTVIQGASGLQYGTDAIGGVILVSPDELRYHQNTAGWVKLTGNSNGWGGGASGLVAGSFTKSGKWAYRVHGTGRINGTQKAPDYLIKNTSSNEYSYSAALGYKGEKFETDVFYTKYSTNLGIFTGSHIGNLSDLNAAFAASMPKDTGVFTYKQQSPRQLVQHDLSKVSLAYNWNKRIRTSLVYGYQFNLRQEYDLHKAYNDSIAALNLPAFELNLWTNSLDLKTEIKHTSHYKSTFGVSGIGQSNVYSGRFFIPNFKKQQFGGYYLGTYENEKWLFDFGLRYDYSRLQVFMYKNNVLINPVKTFQNPSASAGVSRLLGYHWIVRLNAGTAWRPPSINELYSNGLHHGAASIEIGNDEIRKEIVYNTQLGVQYKSHIAKVDVSVFYNYFDGYINLQPSLPPMLTIVGAFPVFRYVQSDVQIMGMNGIIEIPIGKYLNYQFQGNLLLGKDLRTEQYLYGMPSNRITQRLRFSTLRTGSKLNFFAEVELLDVFRQKRYVDNSDYVAPPKGYDLLNTQVGITKKMNSGENLQIILACSNLTNLSYRDYMNRFRYFTDELGRNWTIKALVPFSIIKKEKKKRGF